MTTNDLLKTDILKDYFELPSLSKLSKRNQRVIAERITFDFNLLLIGKLPEDMPDPARDYLKKLKLDNKWLSKIKTHSQDIATIKEKVELKVKILSLYIKRFRQKTTRRLKAHLFFFTMYSRLSPLLSDKRIEIISNLYQLVNKPPDEKVKTDKLASPIDLPVSPILKTMLLMEVSSEPNKPIDKYESLVKQTLHRIKKYYPIKLHKNPMKTVSFWRYTDLVTLNQYKAINRANPRRVIDNKKNKKIHIFLDAPFEEFQHFQAVKTAIEKKINSHMEPFIEMNPTNLKLILLKCLKVKDIPAKLTLLTKDKEFLSAFAMPQLKENLPFSYFR